MISLFRPTFRDLLTFFSDMASAAGAQRFTPTRDEEVEINNAKLAATKSSYETDFLMSQ